MDRNKIKIPEAACTGIMLKSKDGATVMARTIEWGGSYLNSEYVVVPRGHEHISLTPNGLGGMKYISTYGYVGASVENSLFVAEGLNEKGLSAGLFYFPGYGQYVEFDAARRDSTLSDLQVVSYALATCATVEEVQQAINKIDIIALDARASTVHWRFADASGKQMVLEIVERRLCFIENPLGVLTNSPGLEWHLTHLNNFVNMIPGNAPSANYGNLQMHPFGSCSGTIGLPGDYTPPSRFVRAAFYSATAPIYEDVEDTVFQAFHLLNTFDIPIGLEFLYRQVEVTMPSATQWTAVSDLSNIRFYFSSLYQRQVRMIDLKKIDFEKIAYQVHPMDVEKRDRVEELMIGADE